jgi:hypothetical protein
VCWDNTVKFNVVFRVEKQDKDVYTEQGESQVPGGFDLDLSMPTTVSCTIDGEKSPFTFGGDEERGSGSLGVVLRNEIWIVNAKCNTYFGPAQAGIGSLLKDRDKVSLTVKRTFRFWTKFNN